MSIELNEIKGRIIAGLPRQERWIIRNTPLDFDFSPERFDLQYVNPRDIVGGPIPDEWNGCRVFGMYDYAEGGGESP